MMPAETSLAAQLPGGDERKSSMALPAVAMTLGITSIATQLILLREFLGAFGGNELVFGIVLANWMVLTGAGAFLGARWKGRPERPSVLAGLLFLLAVLPPSSVFALRALRNVVFTAGSMIGIAQILAGSFLLLLPYCLVSGFAFTLLTAAATLRRSSAGASVYSWESAGSAVGGIVFNVVLISFLGTFQVLTILFTLDIGLVLFLARVGNLRVLQAGGWCLLALGLWAMLFINADAVSRSYLFPGQEVLLSRDTPYGVLTVTRQGDQVNLFENGVLMSSTNEVTSREENVHYAMLQCRAPRRVLLIGGTVSGTAREVLKYGVDRVDYVEINPWIIDAGRKYASLPDDPGVRVINQDARMYVENTDARYDAVLVNLPDPSTAQLNRCYTLEFFQQAKRILTKEGVVSASLLPAAEYQGRDAKVLGSALLATLRGVFAHVLIVPGERYFFLASDGPLDIRIAGMVGQRKISTLYVNSFYIDDELLEQRSREIMSSFNGGGALNRDFHPVCYSLQLDYWLESLGMSTPWLLVPVAGLFILIFSQSSPIGAGILAGGMVASALEILLLLSFQVLCGSLYQMTGILITAFMAGLAAGSGPVTKLFHSRGMPFFVFLQLLLAGVSFILPVILSGLQSAAIPVFEVNGIFILVIFLIAVLTGMEFAVALSIRRGSRAAAAGTLYGLDLLGSAVGALVVSVFVLPKFGMLSVCALAGVISLAGAARCYFAGSQGAVATS